jgi:hypothetical protein
VADVCAEQFTVWSVVLVRTYAHPKGTGKGSTQSGAGLSTKCPTCRRARPAPWVTSTRVSGVFVAVVLPRLT